MQCTVNPSLTASQRPLHKASICPTSGLKGVEFGSPHLKAFASRKITFEMQMLAPEHRALHVSLPHASVSGYTVMAGSSGGCLETLPLLFRTLSSQSTEVLAPTYTFTYLLKTKAPRVSLSPAQAAPPSSKPSGLTRHSHLDVPRAP